MYIYKYIYIYICIINIYTNVCVCAHVCVPRTHHHGPIVSKKPRPGDDGKCLGCVAMRLGFRASDTPWKIRVASSLGSRPRQKIGKAVCFTENAKS